MAVRLSVLWELGLTTHDPVLQDGKHGTTRQPNTDDCRTLSRSLASSAISRGVRGRGTRQQAQVLEQLLGSRQPLPR